MSRKVVRRSWPQQRTKWSSVGLIAPAACCALACSEPDRSEPAQHAMPAMSFAGSPGDFAVSAAAAGSRQAAPAPQPSAAAPLTPPPVATQPSAAPEPAAGAAPPSTPPPSAAGQGGPTGNAASPAPGSSDRAPSAGSAASGFIRGAEPTSESAASKGPYQVGEIKSGFKKGEAFGGATIYYPLDAQPPFAMIVFCPGWLGTQASDKPWAPFMASHGIVFMNIDTNAAGDSVLQRQKAELDALESLMAEHTRQTSPLAGKLDLTRVSLMGWSMGGGGAWLNAKAHPELRAIVTLAGHNATAGGAEPDRGITVPTLMLAGTADTTVLGLGMSQPVYDVIPDSTPKLLYEVQGASHFDFNDPAFLNGAPARYALSWEKVYLEGDMRYRKFLLEKGPSASDFRTNLQ